MKKCRFVLLYDCPFQKCDKLWLYEGLNKYGEVKIIDIFPKTTYLRLSLLMPKIKLGKIILRFVAFFQTIRAIVFSNRDDIIVVWNYFGGIFMNQILSILKIKRKVVSFCWIDLPKKKNYKKVKKCLLNNNFMPIINDKRLKNEFIDLFGLEKWNGFFLPDVYDDNEKFLEAKYIEKSDNRYCFAGGLNNRDWDVLIDAAKQLSTVKFTIVSDKGSIKRNDIPKNITIYENIDKINYYNLMKNSYLTICPLKEDRVSGLINIIKSIQYGIPCITTKFDVTSSYYIEDLSSILLYEKNNCSDLIDKINKICHLNKKDYDDLVIKMQKHLINEFNPDNNIKNLYCELEKREWV